MKAGVIQEQDQREICHGEHAINKLSRMQLISLETERK